MEFRTGELASPELAPAVASAVALAAASTVTFAVADQRQDNRFKFDFDDWLAPGRGRAHPPRITGNWRPNWIQIESNLLPPPIFAVNDDHRTNINDTSCEINWRTHNNSSTKVEGGAGGSGGGGGGGMKKK